MMTEEKEIKIEGWTDKQIQQLVLSSRKTAYNTSVIKGWVIFFGVAVILGVLLSWLIGCAAILG